MVARWLPGHLGLLANRAAEARNALDSASDLRCDTTAPATPRLQLAACSLALAACGLLLAACSLPAPQQQVVCTARCELTGPCPAPQPQDD